MKWLIPLTTITLLSNCGWTGDLLPEPQVVVQTEYIEREIPIQRRPSPVEMPGVEWYVVTEDNIDEFIARIEGDVGQLVFVAITPNGYENLALGIADLRRYILEQQAIIGYYEEQAQPTITRADGPSDPDG